MFHVQVPLAAALAAAAPALTAVAPQPPCPADISRDGAVGVADLNMLLSSWGAFGPSLSGDLNDDGAVDVNDLNLLLAAFGQQCPTPAVPLFENRLIRFCLDEPEGGAFGDLDGDGVPDLAICTRNCGTVEVYIGDGTGQFAPLAAYDAGQYPMQPSITDADGDGDKDLIVSTRDGVCVLRNRGDGVFISKSRYHELAEHEAMVVVDIDADGDPDCVTARDSGSPQVSILLNDGQGVYSVAHEYSPGLGIQRLATADLNGDGAPDVVVPCREDNWVVAMINDGDGGFALMPPLPLGSSPYSVACEDLDGDGDTDAVVGSQSPPRLMTLLNNGAGALSLGHNTPVPHSATDLHFVDIDLDGVNELIGATGLQDLVYFWDYHGHAFAQIDQYHTGEASFRVAVGDVDCDDAPDLLALSRPGARMWLNRGDGTLTTPRRAPSPFGAVGVAAADFNGDGLADMAVGTSSSTQLFFADGKGAYTEAPAFQLPQTAFHIVATDVDLDGDQDIVGVNSSSAGAVIGAAQINDGAGTFVARIFAVLGSVVTSLDAADFNGDGSPDLAMACRLSKDLNIQLGDGTGGFATLPNIALGDEPNDTAVGDFDGDGDTDIAVAIRLGFNGDGLRVLDNDGNAGFTITPFSTNNFSMIAVEACDLDQDGDTDIVGVLSDNLIAMFFNDGTGGFAPMTTTSVQLTNAGRMIAEDVNNDGLVDLLLSQDDLGSVAVLLGVGRGAFEPAATLYGAGGTPDGIDLADADGDGDLDIFVANLTSRDVIVLRNLGVSP